LGERKIVEKIYKTGDLARYLTDGNIEFLGRIDNQVKLRGFRIELGEIETALNQYHLVRESVVMLREDQPKIKYLAAYLRLKTEIMVTDKIEAELRTFLKQQLPEYMVPTAFVFLDQFPLTGSGKIDRRALPAPNLKILNENLVTARTPLEQYLVILWAEVLKLPQVGIFDNFFDLGGHSLTANQVVSKIHKSLAKKLTLKEFFTHPTIAEIAELLEKRGRSDLPPIQPVKPQPHYPLSYAQRRLWTATQMTGDSAAYNMVGGFILSGHLDIVAFKQCFNLLISRHESLRTRFIMVAGEPRQEILPELPFIVTELDIADQGETAAQHEFYQELQSTFDLREVPLLRVKLLKLPSDSAPCHLCIVNMHHIIGDGVSVEILFKEIISLYRDLTENRPNSLQPLKVHYKDYVFWQAAVLESEEGLQHRHYWLQQFADEIPVLDLPTDFPRPAIQTQQGEMLKFFLNADLTRGLHELNKQQNVSLFMMVVSLVNSMLYLYTQQEDIVVGSPVAGHNHPDLEQQIGFYVNTLALRTRFSGSDNFVDLLAKVKQVATDAYAHQDYPFDKLVEELNLQRDLSRTPLFDVMVILQNYEPVSFDLPNILVQSFMDDASVTSKFDLNLMFEEMGAELGVWVEYNTDLFKRETMMLFADNFVKLVQEIIVNPQEKLSNFKMLFTTTCEQQEQSQFLQAITEISDDF
jgi:acyl carrier protein